MIFPDYHLHTHHSTDSDEAIKNIIETALSNGINEICLTDHHDIDFPMKYSYEEGVMTFQLDYDAYSREIDKIKGSLPDGFTLKKGVELGVMPSTTDKAHEYASSHSDLDFLICSTHIVDDFDPYYPEYYEGKTPVEAYGRYFECILETVKGFTDFDVYGHLDYIVRYGDYKDYVFELKDYFEVFEELLRIIISAGKGIEINTGSLYKNLSYPHPHKEILKLYKSLGGEIITVGSDAHFAKYVGYGFDKARELLLECGFKAYATFDKRKPVFHDIP